MHQIDWLLIAAYLLGVVGLGVAAGFRRGKGTEGGHYFLADNSLKWPVIGLAMFAANISTVHLVSFAEAAYKHGLVFGNFEWMAGFVLVLLSLFFAPLYLRSKVATLPDFIERRFDRRCRDVLSVVSLFSALVIHMGVALFTAAYVLRGILGMTPDSTVLGMDALMFFIMVLGLLTGWYTMSGGLLAVVWTESVQTVLLITGAVVITVVAWIKVGGWHGLSETLATHAHPMAHAAKDPITYSTGNFLHILRPAGDPSTLTWYSILLGYPVVGIWYWCCDQTIVQRVLAAKDARHARLGPLFCAFLKILPVFVFVLPGVMCVALVQQNAFGGAAPATAADAYTFMITHLLPLGLKGLVVAAMLAAAMQTCSAALNSTATLFAYDIYKRLKPATTDHQLVFVGKVTTVAGTLFAIVTSPIFGKYTTIFEGISKMICYVAPPITAVFLMGVFWRKATARGAFATMAAGGLMGGVIFALDFWKKEIMALTLDANGKGGWLTPVASWIETYVTKDFMLTSFFMCAICCGLVFVVSLAKPEPLKDEARDLVWEDWREPLRGDAMGHGLGNYRILAAVVVACFIGLYVLMR